jgi:hypothetical protein
VKKLLFSMSLTTLLLFSILAHAATSAPKLPQTGQTSCYDTAGATIACSGTGQSGELQSGLPWPVQRFIDNGNGTVTDSLTGLIWLKNANCFGGQAWTTAIASANALASGKCGLSDGSAAGQWRLPNVMELRSLVNEQQANSAAWLNTQGFSNVQAYNYWSSSTYASYTDVAWYVSMSNGNVYNGNKTDIYYVWPVRGGQ